MNRELARRIAFTIGALLVLLVGENIPVTGIWTSNGPLPPGAMVRLSIFSLNLVPYLSAAIIVRLLSMMWGRLTTLERSGEKGRRRIARYTLLVTLLLAAFQAYGVATAIGKVPELAAARGGWFALSTTASLVGGVFFLIWLSEQITRHGIGNGLALVLSVGILVSLPGDVAGIFELVKRGILSGDLVLVHGLVWVAVVAVIVFVESARRNVPIEFAERKIGDRLLPARSAVLPLKINNAGLLLPATVVSWIFLPVILAAVAFSNRAPWLVTAYQQVQFAWPGHLIVAAIATFVLVFIYTAYVVDPEHAAESCGSRAA